MKNSLKSIEIYRPNNTDISIPEVIKIDLTAITYPQLKSNYKTIRDSISKQLKDIDYTANVAGYHGEWYIFELEEYYNIDLELKSTSSIVIRLKEKYINTPIYFIQSFNNKEEKLKLEDYCNIAKLVYPKQENAVFNDIIYETHEYNNADINIIYLTDELTYSFSIKLIDTRYSYE